MTPYFYKIMHIPSGRYYVGSQYGKNSDPTNLLTSYITSSKYVKQIIEKDGIESFKIVKILIRDDARDYEAKYLSKVYRLLGKDKFLQILINRNLSPGILLTKEIIEKANKKRKISNSIAAKKLLEEGRHNFQINNASNYEHVRKERAERMKGNNYGSYRNVTDELKQKLAEKSKGNTNVRGTRWWTNGTINKRSKECPGEGFYLGTTKV